MKENELEIFNFDEDKKAKDLLKQAKIKGNTRIMGISLGITTLTLVLIIILKIQITPWLIDKKTSDLYYYYNTHGANTFLGTWQETYKLVGSNATAVRYKLIDGIPYEIENINLNEPQKYNKLNMGTDIDWFNNQNAETFSYKGEHIMKFYHPQLEFKDYKNDLSLLEKIDSDKKIEMALSFDKAYTLEEVKQMIPKSLTWNWSWVDTFDEFSINAIKEMDNGITYTPNIILEEDEVVGFSMINQVGEIKSEPEKDFLENIKLLSKTSNEYKNYKIDEIKIIGIVVSGEKERLLQLIDKSFIKASSFGVITEIY